MPPISIASFGPAIPPSVTDPSLRFPGQTILEDGFGPDGRGWVMVVRIGPLTLRMRWIPPGTAPKWHPTFTFKPPRRDRLVVNNGFWLSETPISRSLHALVMGRDPDGPHNADDVATGLTFNEAMAFLTHLGRIVPWLNPELPNDEAWEYACRAGDPTWTSDGDAEAILAATPEGRNASDAREFADPMPGPNPWGLYGMEGRLWQWCHDGHLMTVPGPRGPVQDMLHILRGKVVPVTLQGGETALAGRVFGERETRRQDVGLRIATGHLGAW